MPALVLICHSAMAEKKANSWEEWLLVYRNQEKMISSKPLRPDGKPLPAPLPLWVDCHLSWLSDHNLSSKAPKGIVIVSNAKLCIGQLEELSREQIPR